MTMRRSVISHLLIWGGAGAVVLASTVDLLGMGGTAGFGTSQMVMVLLGFVLLSAGLILRYDLTWRSVFARSASESSSNDILLVAVWFGLLCGFFEIGLLFTQPLYYSLSDFLWMPLVTDSIIFIVIGLVLVPIARFLPKICPLRIAIFILAFLAFLNLRSISYKVHIYAWMILAAGLAFQTSYLILKSDFFRLMIRRTTVFMAVLAVGLTASVNFLQFNGKQRAVANLPKAPPDTPNVLFIVLDTVRSKSLSLYGYERQTSPQLQRIAKKGVLFEKAWSPSPWTLPAHGSMFTAHLPFELSTNWQSPLDDTYPTLAEALRDRGYLTAGFVANFSFCTSKHGIDRGFIHYEDYPRSLGMFAYNSYLGKKIFNMTKNTFGFSRPIVYKDATTVNEEFLRWLSQNKHQPFFAFLNYFDAHTPYLSPEPFSDMFGSDKPKPSLQWDAPAPWWEFTNEQRQVLLDAYENAIAYIDHELGLLFDQLEKQRVLDNTLVIITSDHGEQFGEHDLFGHGNSLYRSLLHVPLLISYPSHVPADRRVRERVTLCDLPATVLDLLDFEAHSPFPGNSLAQYWGEENDQNRSESAVISGLRRGVNLPKQVKQRMPHRDGDMGSVVIGDMHYIKNGDDSEELYNLATDSTEEHNLIGIKKYDTDLLKCRETIDTLLTPDSTSNDIAFHPN